MGGGGELEYFIENTGHFRVCNFHEFLTLGSSTKFRIREFTYFISSAIIIIIFAGFMNLRICPPREIREN